VKQHFSERISRHLAAAAAAGLLAAWPVLGPLAGRAEVTSLTLHDPGRSEVTNPDAALAIARRRLLAHDVLSAVGGLERYLSVYPQELVVRRFLGDVYFRVGDFQRAEATYREIVEGYPFDSEAHHRLGMLDILEQRLDAAIREFGASLPESIDDLVMAHERKGDLDQFERSLQRRAASRPGDADVQYEMAETYGDLRLPYDAVTYFHRALAIYPTSIDFLNGMAVAQMQIHDDAAAEQTFARCLHYDPDSYACRNDLGSLYIDQKRYDAAARELNRAHELAPEGPEALVNLGYLADERGNRRDAVAYYDQAIDAWPYSSDAYVDLSFDDVQQGMIDQADAVLLKGLTVAPDDTRIHYLLGVVDEVRGKRAEAVVEFRSAEQSLIPEIAVSARESISEIEGSTNAGGPPVRPPR
jgi:protein O-GlcNAc transferase